MSAMKTTIHILTVIFALNVTLLFAGDPKLIVVKDKVNSVYISLNNSELAPVTPKEADFEDYDPLPFPAISRLAPITPKEATFEDIKDEFTILSIDPLILQKIAPVTPGEAEFEDTAAENATR